MDARSFGPFALVKRLGEGAFGTVYEAHDPRVGRSVALKILRGGARAHIPEQRFRREAEALARVRHPNVVGVHETGSFDGVPFIALELVRGRPLDKLLEDGTSSE